MVQENNPADSGRNAHSKLNDFVVRFANVNGTGSASANALFTKAVFRMGIPVTPKNIFPSNIQGLPTWYEVRVNEKGYLGRREGIDLMIAVNPQSMQKDYRDVMTGGYFLYDSSKPLPPDYDRDDITHIGIPLMALSQRRISRTPGSGSCSRTSFISARLSKLFDIEFTVLEGLIGEQFKGKEKLIEPNIKALNIGVNYVAENFECPLHIRVERRDLDRRVDSFQRQFGVRARGRFTAVRLLRRGIRSRLRRRLSTPLPNTPKNTASITNTGKNNFAIVQAEDELAAIGMVIGANWNGARSFTATSGPGRVLMNEFLGSGLLLRDPDRFIDVQRTGPSTGMPTRTQQSDILEAAYASHGDTKHPLLLPSSPYECFEMTAQAFDLTEELQTPVMVMTDLDLGMNDHVTRPLVWDDENQYNRGKVLDAEALDKIEKYGRYLDPDGDGIAYRTIPGTHPSKGAYVTRGSFARRICEYTEDSDAYRRNVDRLMRKWDTAKELVPQPEFYQSENASKYGVVFFGTSKYAAEEAIALMTEAGIQLDAMRPKAFPFGKAFVDFIEKHEKVFVIEQNRDAQFKSLMMIELGTNPAKLVSVLNYDGTPITAGEILDQIRPNLDA